MDKLDMEAALKLLSAAANATTRSTTAKKNIPPLCGEHPALLLSRITRLRAPPSPSPSSRPIPSHRHHFHTVPLHDHIDCSSTLGASHAFLCCQCRLWLTVNILPISGDNDDDDNKADEECPLLYHHLHYSLYRGSEGAYTVECCGCSFGLEIKTVNPVVPFLQLGMLQLEAGRSDALIDAALGLVAKLIVNIVVKGKTNARINPAGKAYTSKLGPFASSPQILQLIGFSRGPDGFWDPPPDSPANRIRMAQAFLELSFDVAYRAFVASSQAAGEDPSDATEIIHALVRNAEYPRFPDTSEAFHVRSIRAESFFLTLGILSDASDELVVWTAERSIHDDPAHIIQYLAALRGIADVRDSPGLHASIPIIEAANKRALRVQTGLDGLGLDPDATDAEVLETFQDKAARATPKQLGHLCAFLEMVSLGRPEAHDSYTALLAAYRSSSSLPSPRSSTSLGRLSESEQIRKAIELSQQTPGSSLGLPGVDSPTAHLSRTAFSNPSFMLRSGTGLPAGLINIGQSCYFNSFIQAVFSVHAFRAAVLSYARPGESAQEGEEEDPFALALQELFALMALGVAPSYNPSKLMHALRTESGQRVVFGSQEDAGEYFNVFLEQAVSVLEGESGTKIHSLFHGEVTHARSVLGAPPERSLPARSTQEFNRLILELETGSIYSALDAYTSPSPVEYNGEACMTQALLSSLPEVLILQVSRVAYSVARQSSIKRNTPFAFPQQLYLDRYLEANSETVAELRGTDEALKARQAALEEEKARLEATTCLAETRELAASSLGAGLDLVPGLDLLAERVQTRLAEVETELAEIATQRAEVYAPCQTSPYELHAVLVHEGYASGGHYYVFVRKTDGPGSPQWLKINDENVDVVSEDEVRARAVGGTRDALSSAYAFVYLAPDLAASNVVVSDPVDVGGLSSSLACVVEESNATLLDRSSSS